MFDFFIFSFNLTFYSFLPQIHNFECLDFRHSGHNKPAINIDKRYVLYDFFFCIFFYWCQMPYKLWINMIQSHVYALALCFTWKRNKLSHKNQKLSIIRAFGFCCRGQIAPCEIKPNTCMYVRALIHFNFRDIELVDVYFCSPVIYSISIHRSEQIFFFFASTFQKMVSILNMKLI